MEQFRGIFRLTYAGDAYIVLRTKVQVCALCRRVPYVCVLPYSNHPVPPMPMPMPSSKNSETIFFGFAFPCRGVFAALLAECSFDMA